MHGLSLVSCAQTTEPIEMLFGLKEACVTKGTWRIWLNHLSVAAMRPYVTLL